MVASGQSAFTSKEKSHSALVKHDDLRSPMSTHSTTFGGHQFKSRMDKQQVSLATDPLDQGMKNLFQHPNSTKHHLDLPLNLNEDSKMEGNSFFNKTGSQFSTKYSQIGGGPAAAALSRKK